MINDPHGSGFECNEVDLGERKISQMNYSFVLTIPKKFVQNTRHDRITHVRLIMIGGYLKLVPSRAKNGDEEIILWKS